MDRRSSAPQHRHRGDTKSWTCEAYCPCDCDRVASNGYSLDFLAVDRCIKRHSLGVERLRAFGEDVSLQKLFTAPLVEGFQGRALSDPGSVATTLKHFVADGATDGGVDRGNATISMEEIRKMHLPGFIAGLSAGSPAVMASFSSVNGEKVHGSKLLLDDLLRQELGFDGVLLTDWEGVTLSGLSLKQGLDAGIDMFMFAQSWRESLPKLLALVEDGEVSESRIDESVVRILTMKQKLGLFQNHV